MTDEQFEKLVGEGIDALPERVRSLMHNVAILIDDVPTAEQQRLHDSDGVLFGLYEGIPLTERGVEYAELPDRITIFRKSILEAYDNPEDIRACVANTIWHEVAHHFGYGEEWIEQEEEKRGKQL